MANNTIGSISNLVSEGVYRNKANSYEVVYRAPSKKRNTVEEEIPSIFRDVDYEKNENLIYKDFIAAAPQEFENTTTFDNLTKMRHYWVPNRLLDVTYDPLLALLFACGEKENGSKQIIFYKVKKENIKYYDSDTVTILSALSKLKYCEREKIRIIVNFFKDKKEEELNPTEECFNKLEEILKKKAKELKSFCPIERPSHDTEKEKNFNKNDYFNKYVSYYAPQLDWEIRKEQPSWYPNIFKIKTFTECYLVKPKMNNPRIIAQSGAFFIFPFQDTNIQTALANGSYIKDVDRITKIKKDLESLNITGTKYMPELDNFAKEIMRNYSKRQ